MKIDLQSISPENFMVHQHFIGEHEVFLVQPVFIGAKYSRETTVFRSSVWDSSGNLVSPSWRKFFNADESPTIEPLPEDISGGSIHEKIDGSTAIFSLFKNNLIMRTRGTVDASTQLNGHEFVFLAEKYNIKKVLEELNQTEGITVLFELTSPIQKIVISYGNSPELWLTGAIRHNDYSYLTQDELDVIAVKYGFIRPKRYSFKTIEEMRLAVDAFKGVEGVCFYYNGGQSIRKFKACEYLALHRMKSEISSQEKVIDVFIDWFMQFPLDADTGYQAFFQYLTNKFDFEIATMARGHASNICDGMKEVRRIMAALVKCAEECKSMTRKDAAARIIQAYSTTGRSSIIFKLLDNKVLCSDDWRKILYQVLKN